MSGTFLIHYPTAINQKPIMVIFLSFAHMSFEIKNNKHPLIKIKTSQCFIRIIKESESSFQHSK